MDTLSRLYNDEVIDIIDKVCSKYIPADQTINIDQLELNIGIIASNNLEQQFPKLIEREIERQIFNLVKNQSLSLKLNNNDSIEDKIHTDQQAFIYFIKSGHLPWWYGESLAKLKTESLKNNKWFRPIKAEIKNAILSKNSRKRFIYFYNYDELKLVCTSLIKQLEIQFQTVDQVIIWLEEVQHSNFTEWATIANQMLTEFTQRTDFFLSFLEIILQGDDNEQKSTYRRLIQSQIKTTNQLYSIKDLFLEIVQKQKIEEVFSLKSQKQFNKFKLLTTKSKSPIIKQVNPKTKYQRSTKIGESLLVDNAGIILVWPYLQTFFTGLGLMKSKSFINKNAAAKAVHLLHYLAFGELEGDESQWILNKLLCGLYTDEFIQPEISLLKSEKEEADHLLSSVIRNWSALKNTKPSGLRVSFLQRPGILLKEENGWLLKIERKGIDILLDKLTWPISVIKLPWTEYMIQVQW